MMADTVRLVGPRQKEFAKRLIDAAGEGYVMRIGKETRTEAQNRKLHPMLDDIRRQVPEMAAFNRDDMRLRFLNALGAEMRFLPTLEGEGVFPVGLRSSTLTKAQFSGLLELLYEYGAKRGVQWTDPAERRAA
jgi:hypothetical protein